VSITQRGSQAVQFCFSTSDNCIKKKSEGRNNKKTSTKTEKNTIISTQQFQALPISGYPSRSYAFVEIIISYQSSQHYPNISLP